MNRLQRITAILIQLQSKRIVKAQEIADRFGISLRTVYRDIRTLEEAGVPISSEAGIGYFLVDGYQLPPVHFTQEEANALLLGNKLMKPFGDASVTEQFHSALLKIQAVLKTIQKDGLEQLDKNIAVQHPMMMPVDTNAFMAPLQTAIMQRKVVKMCYKSSYRGELTYREVEPIGLNFYAGAWHFIAWCRLRADYRDFRTDRITEVELLSETFRLSDRMGLEEYLEQQVKETPLFKAVIRVKKEVYPFMINHKYMLGFVKEVELGDHVEVEFLTFSLDFFARSILMYENQIEIVEPPHLKQKMVEMVIGLAGYYTQMVDA